MIDLEPNERYSAELPKTMVTPSMREQIVQIAKQRKLSVAELNRRLWQKFLDETDGNPSTSAPKPEYVGSTIVVTGTINRNPPKPDPQPETD